MEIFRDRENGFIITYWVLKKDESFYTCTLNHLERAEDGKVDDLGCTFISSGNLEYQESNRDSIDISYEGDIHSRRYQKSIKITSVTDVARFLYCADLKSMYTINQWEDPNKIISFNPRIIRGENILLKVGDLVDITDTEKDFYITNPFLNAAPNVINYKFSEQPHFTNLPFGKAVKVEKGRTVTVQSAVKIYIPKFFVFN